MRYSKHTYQTVFIHGVAHLMWYLHSSIDKLYIGTCLSYHISIYIYICISLNISFYVSICTSSFLDHWYWTCRLKLSGFYQQNTSQKQYVMLTLNLVPVDYIPSLGSICFILFRQSEDCPSARKTMLYHMRKQITLVHWDTLKWIWI